MAVLLDTSVGDIVIDLFTEDCPITTKNFLKLCKIKYYNGCLFFNLQPNFIIQTGDPTGTGKGGISIYGKLYGEQALCFQDEFHKHIRHTKTGLVSMANNGIENTNRSQFFITLRDDDLNQLDDKHTIFGVIAEGMELLETLNNLYIDDDGRPYQDVRIKHTHILDDPFPDPPQLQHEIPPTSPNHLIPPDETVLSRIPYEENIESTSTSIQNEVELENSIKRKEAKSRAIVLEMTGDIPDAEIKPPDEVLFICKLNSITTDEDLELIFSRFGHIKECAIIRDYKTGESLNYAFIEFDTEEACIEAYEKMNNVLIDDRRIKVDFSQSVSKLWNRFHMRPRNEITKGQIINKQHEIKKDKDKNIKDNKLKSYQPPAPVPLSSSSSNSRLQFKNQTNTREKEKDKQYSYEFDDKNSNIYEGNKERERNREREKGEKRFPDKEKKRKKSRSRSRSKERKHSSSYRDKERERERDRERNIKRDRSRDRDGYGSRSRR